MAIKESVRPGGRSARVQESIHQAVRALLEEQDRASLTVPQIAARAGVTPSTIYRRWGDLAVLLADVAFARMRPEVEPANTGSLRGDLRAWAEQYLDEISSEPGRQMMRDVQCSPSTGYCTTILGGQLQTILDRYPSENLPSVERLLDLIVAPTVFRVLFADAPLSVDALHRQIELALTAP